MISSQRENSIMKRKDFLLKTGIGIISGPFILHALGDFNQVGELCATKPLFNCVLFPETTRGPFYLDPEYDRRDITEGEPGLPFRLRVQVLGVDNCEPIPSAVVNLWHCDIRGAYSEFGLIGGNPINAADETWMRGYQMTNAEGWAEFDTIFPGWYPGRATHIHFDVHIGFSPSLPINQQINASSTFISQMFVPNSVKTLVYTTIPAYFDKGDNPTGTHNDGIAQNSGAVEDLTIAFDETDFPTSISGEFVIGLDMAGTPVGVEELKGFKYFELYQNSPNPFSYLTIIPFTMKTAGTVTLSVFSNDGELISQLVQRKLTEGAYNVTFDRTLTGQHLNPGTYMFEMMVQLKEGRFRQARKMIIL